METVSYEEYLALSRAQLQRDRERFMGVDPHPEAPLFSALDGRAVRAPVGEAWLPAHVWDALCIPPEMIIRMDSSGYGLAGLRAGSL